MDKTSEEATMIAAAKATLRTHLPLLAGADLEPQRDHDGGLVRDRWGRLVFPLTDHPHQDAHVAPDEQAVYLYEGDPDFPSVWVSREGEIIAYCPPVDTRPAPS